MSHSDVPESIAVTLRVVRLLEQLGVRYAIGASMASTIYGEIRSTVDADIVAELGVEHLESFVQGLGDDFYRSEEQMREATASGRSFNLIALGPMFKIDIFIAKGQLFESSQLDRRVHLLISREPPESAYVSLAEDVVLAKLIWYRRGGEVSERQWQDVLGVIRVQGPQLDMGYMHRMASLTGISDLLVQAISDASPGSRS